MITKSINLYLGDGFPARIPVSQYDTMWQFVFTIIHNSQPWQIPTGATAVLNGKKPDGNVFAFAGAIENNAVTVDADVQMTAVAGQTVCELSILSDGMVVGTANFILDVEAAPKSPEDVSSESTLPVYEEMLDQLAHTATVLIPNRIKDALLECFQQVAWVSDDGPAYYSQLEHALYDSEVVSISAVFEQGTAVVYDVDQLDALKQYLTVTANYDDGTSSVVTTYTLAGELTAGTSTITVSYGVKNTTFDVVVTSYIPIGYTRLEALKSTGAQYIDTGINFTSAMKYEIEVSGLVNGTSENKMAFGAFGTGSTYPIGLFLYKNSGTDQQDLVRAWFRGYPNTIATVSTNGLGFVYDTNTKYKCAQKGIYAWLDDVQLSNTFTDATWTVDVSFALFCRHSASTGFGGFMPCTIYSAKFYDGNDNLIHDFIPCLDSNNVPCMFDAITRETKYNLGTGTFDYVEVT